MQFFYFRQYLDEDIIILVKNIKNLDLYFEKYLLIS